MGKKMDMDMVMFCLKRYLCNLPTLAAGERVGVFAVFPIALQESDVTFLILIGYLFLTTDIPDFGPGTDMQAIRVTRGVWSTAQWTYMAVLTAAYYFLVGILELVFFIPSLQISGGWGAGVTSGAISGGSYPLAVARSFLEHGAWKECLAVFALVVLLSLVIPSGGEIVVNGERIGEDVDFPQ